MRNLIALLLLSTQAFAGTVNFDKVTAATSISAGTTAAASSTAVLDLVSTTKGMLPPRMTTTQRDAIGSPVDGLACHNTTTHRHDYYNGTSWLELSSLTGTETLTNKTLSGNTAVTLISGSGTLTLNTSGTTTVPNATDTLVGKATTDTLTNKTLSDTTTVVGNASDVAKALKFDLSGATTAKTMTLASPHTNNRTITLPDATTTLVGTDTTQTLTNKSIVASQITGQVAIANGGTAVSSVTTAPTASSFSGWDAQANLSADSFINGYTTTATAAGTTTLTVDSKGQQYFTGSTTQTVALPVTSTLVLGETFVIVNLSSGVVTVQSSGGNTLQAMAANTQLVCTVILTSGTGTASWNWTYQSVQSSSTGGGTITALTGDVTASGSGSVAATAAATQANIVTLSKSTGVALHGTNTNDNAATGYVGEYFSISGTGQSFPTSGQYGDCGGTSITIGAGDWDVSLVLSGNSATTAAAGFYAGISTTTGNSSSGLTSGDNFANEQFNLVTNSGDNTISIPNYRMSVSGSTTVYCKVESTYTGSPKYDYRMSARRVR